MTVKIFIGCSGNDEDLEFQAVLHYTLEKYSSEPLDITWMRLSRDPQSFWYSDPQKCLGWNTQQWHTPFSALRWGVPAACGFQGKAIYLDVDMILRDDIVKLWNQEFKNGAGMISKKEAICVTMYDNARMKEFLPPIDYIRKQPRHYIQVRNKILQSPNIIQRYTGGNWNCLDMRNDKGGEYKSVDDPDIKILHFTMVPTQPHLRHAIPRLNREGGKHWFVKGKVYDHHRKDCLSMFDRLLEEAQANGYTLDRYRNVPKFGDYGR